MCPHCSCSYTRTHHAHQTRSFGYTHACTEMPYSCTHSPLTIVFFWAEISSIEMRALDKYMSRITSAIDVDATLKILLRERVITRALSREVMQTPSSERVGRILDVIRTRGDRAFRTLCEALKRKHPELAYLMLKETYRKDEEIFW